MLDRSNIIYLVKEIIKLKYKNLAFLMLDDNRISAILKIIIFINNINKPQYIAAYFCIMFLFIFQKKQVKIICIFSLNLKFVM